jgi:hypothetical protein
LLLLELLLVAEVLLLILQLLPASVPVLDDGDGLSTTSCVHHNSSDYAIFDASCMVQPTPAPLPFYEKFW